MTDNVRAALMRPGTPLSVNVGIRLFGGILGAVSMYLALVWLPRAIAASPAIHADLFASQLASEAGAFVGVFLWPAVALAFLVSFAYVGIRATRGQTAMALFNALGPALLLSFFFTLTLVLVLALAQPAHKAAQSVAARTNEIDAASSMFCKARSESFYGATVNVMDLSASVIPVSCESRSGVIQTYTVDLSKYGAGAGTSRAR